MPSRPIATPAPELTGALVVEQEADASASPSAWQEPPEQLALPLLEVEILTLASNQALALSSEPKVTTWPLHTRAPPDDSH